MTFFFTLAFFLMAAGTFLLFRISPFELLSQLMSIKKKRKVKLQKRVKQSVKPKKLRGIKKIIKEAKNTLKTENKINSFSNMCLISFALAIVGVLIASAMNNMFLMPILAAGFALLPFLFILLMSGKNKKQLNASLETALSVITSSYMRTESVITAVSENIDQLDPQIRCVFQKFLVQAEMINPDIPKLLEDMKYEIDNSVFHEWIDAMILCQNDRNLKSTLLPIVNKLSDMRIVSGELDYLLYEPLKEFIVMALLVLFEIPFIRSQSQDWYDILMYSPAGKVLIAINAMVLIVSFIAVIRNTRPIEYRR